MSFQQHYRGAIWTNHALERLGQRGLSQEMAGETFNKPDRFIKGKKPDTIEYQKSFGNSLVTLIAKQNEKKEWIILSCWIDPPLPGSIDLWKKEQYNKYRKASVWGQLWLIFKRSIGLSRS